MRFLDGAFLAGAHGVAVIDTGADKAADAVLKGVRIAELSAAVSEEHVEEALEVVEAEFFLQAVEDSSDRALRASLEEVGKEETGIRKAEGEDTLVGTACGDDRIHFCEVSGGKAQGLEVLIGTAGKDRTVRDGLFSLVSLPWPELDFALKVYVPGGKDAGIDVVIERFHGHIEFRMVAEDVVG